MDKRMKRNENDGNMFGVANSALPAAGFACCSGEDENSLHQN